MNWTRRDSSLLDRSAYYVNIPVALFILNSHLPGALWGPNAEASIPITPDFVSALPVSRWCTNF